MLAPAPDARFRSVFARLARFERFEPALYGLLAGALTLFVATRFYSALKLELSYAEAWTGDPRFASFIRHSGRWSAPLDDVFIHFDFARSISRGHPFEWSRGAGYSSGGTSLLYPFVLALGIPLGFRDLRLMEWAAMLAMASVFALLLACRQAFRGLPRAATYLTPFVLLSIGALDWSLFSGMEVAMFLALWGGAFANWARTLQAFGDKLADAGANTLSRAAWIQGAWGVALVATRPEALVLVGLFAASFGFRRWSEARELGVKRRASASLVVTLRALAPAALVLAAQSTLNRIMTGESTAAGALVKLEAYHPYLSSREVLDAWVFHLKYQILRLTQYHVADQPAYGWLLWVLAFLAFIPRATRRHAFMLWASALGWMLIVALNGQVRWQNERYAMPALAFLLLAAALGLGAALTAAWQRERRWFHVTQGALASVFAALLVWHQLPRFRDQIWFFGRASRNIMEQHIRTALLLRHELSSTPSRVLVGDAGAIPYVSDLPALDIIGLGGFHGLPFAQATRADVAAGLELIERLDPKDRPDVMAIYPSWWNNLPLWFGQRITEVPVRGNVICGGASKVVYRTDFTPFEGSAWPHLLQTGERVADDIDIADLVSEKEHAYRLPRGGVGYVTMKILANPQKPEQGLWDAGRVIAPGMSEAFRLRGIDPKRPFRLLARVAPSETLKIPVRIDHESVGVLSASASDAWQELELEIKATGTLPEVVFEPSDNERSVYHVWAVQTP